MEVQYESVHEEFSKQANFKRPWFITLPEKHVSELSDHPILSVFLHHIFNFLWTTSLVRLVGCKYCDTVKTWTFFYWILSCIRFFSRHIIMYAWYFFLCVVCLFFQLAKYAWIFLVQVCLKDIFSKSPPPPPSKVKWSTS